MANPLFRSLDPDVRMYPHEEAEPMGQTEIHHLWIMALLDFLRAVLHGRDDARLVADQFIYYVEGHPEKTVAPDIALYLGVTGPPRRVWKTWEERGKVPDLVFEVLSDTSAEDLGAKRAIYARLGVREYVVLDPERSFVPEGVRGYRLDDGDLDRVRPEAGGRVRVATVGMLIGVEGDAVLAWREDGSELADYDGLVRDVEARDRELEARDRELEARDREIAALRARLAETKRPS